MSAPLAQFSIGVVVERRKAQSPWIDFTWRPIAVLPGAPDTAPWTQLSVENDAACFYAGAAVVELYRSETAHYRDNLATGAPMLWVVLRLTGIEPPLDLVAVTADPAEGEGFTQNGDYLVETVPMPDAVRSAVEAFVAEHHVERPFVKRKRDRADPDALGRRAPWPKDGGKDGSKDRTR
ncbi:MAG: DUF3305 domain-containing protein [Hyphomicrobiales bacterium]|nr:DUF3305 domain-containing protein [Hyphomicrobiales bacterium]